MRYRSPHRQVSNLDLVVDLAKQQLSFTWFTDVRGTDDDSFQASGELVFTVPAR